MLRQSTTDAAMDPFLSGINEQHARQESADSGLGLGSAYSLPHTPEDFLANIDDNMDGTSGKRATLFYKVVLIYNALRRNVKLCSNRILRSIIFFVFQTEARQWRRLICQL